MIKKGRLLHRAMCPFNTRVPTVELTGNIHELEQPQKNEATAGRHEKNEKLGGE